MTEHLIEQRQQVHVNQDGLLVRPAHESQQCRRQPHAVQVLLQLLHLVLLYRKRRFLVHYRLNSGRHHLSHGLDVVFVVYVHGLHVDHLYDLLQHHYQFVFILFTLFLYGTEYLALEFLNGHFPFHSYLRLHVFVSDAI